MELSPDLKSRIPVGITYVLVIAGACLYGTSSALALVAVFYIMCLYEFVSAHVSSQIIKSIHLGIGIGIAAFIILGSVESRLSTYSIALISCLAHTLSVIYLIAKKSSIFSIIPFSLSLVVYIVLPFVCAFLFLKGAMDSHLIILGVFIILWLNDAGAYFVGRAIGNRKLFKSVSPNKSWEGSIGGGIVGILISVAVANLIGGYPLAHWLIISVIVWVAGTYGDLIESSWKRSLNLKDSGTIMKGHGGFLDRLDSFIYAVPFVILYHHLFVV